MSKLTFKVEGMCCSEEIASIKKALGPLVKGEEDRVIFDLIGEKLIIEQQDDLPTEGEIIKAVDSTGMKATAWNANVRQRRPSEPLWRQHGPSVMTALSALMLVTGFIVDSIENGASTAIKSDGKQNRTYPTEVLVLYSIAILSGILFVLPKAFRSIWRLRPDMNLLMTIAVIGAAEINQWFDAATASSLFSASLLLESWNLNRARKSIRALVEIAPSTARVVEKRIVRTHANEKYIRHYVAEDGECGYTSLGITRANALKQLLESLDSVKNILKPAVRECLLIDRFYEYLVLNEAIPKDVTHQEIIENIERYATDTNILNWYLYFDVRDKQIDAGWAHPCVLQALAHVHHKEIRMWRLNDRNVLIPHRGNEYDYTIYIPTDAQERIDILFINGNHFERLEFYENGNAIENASSPISDYSMEQNITIEKMVEEVPVNSIILVRPGEKIPLDSILISGITDVNQAPITGESMPVRKEVGDGLFAGTINGDTAILCRVTREASDSTLARIIHMVEAAQSRRAKSQQFIEKFALYYTPAMLAIAVLIMIILPTAFHRSWKSALYQALELLVISCPCALVISTPVSIAAALNTAARSGVLIKGGIYLEAPARIKAIALDKTGTLTSGEPTVQEIISLDEQTEDDLLKLALALEEHSDHPLARAIRRKAKSEGIFTDKQVKDFHIFKGKGAEGYLEGKLYWIGSHRLLQEKVSELSSALLDRIQNLSSTGHSIVVIGYDQHLCGLIAISDSVRAGCANAIQALKQKGIKKVVMLTGDNEGSAKAIARSVGIDEYHAELLPEDKVKQVELLVQRYRHVAMVGDGVNDAPAMAAASLSIAMGAAGSDTAIETADIALMADDLEKLSWLIRHSRRTLFIIKQNVAISLFIKAIFMGLAIANKSTLGMAVAADIGSSFIVVFNGLRLLNNRLFFRWNIKKETARPMARYNDSEQPHLVVEHTDNSDGITLRVLGKKDTFFVDPKVSTAAPKKSCCSGGGCSKLKEPVLVSGSDASVLPTQAVGDSNKLTFFAAPAAQATIKKSCCSDDSCSEKNLALVSVDQPPSAQAVGDNNELILKVSGGRNAFFAVPVALATTKDSCCNDDSCSKSNESALVLSNSRPILLEQATGDVSQVALNSGNESRVFLTDPTAKEAPKKSCCSSGSCLKSKEPSLVSNSNQPVVSAQIAPLETITSLAANADAVKEMATQLKPPSPPSPKT